MELVVTLLIGLLVGVALGGVVGWLLAGRREEPVVDDGRVDPAVLEERHARLLAEVRAGESSARAQVQEELARADEAAEGLRRELEAARAQYRETVERHRTDAAQREAAERAESKVLQALRPVQESLRTMQTKVSDLESQRSRQHGELAEQIRNTRASAELSRQAAETLASAMSNNSVRGVWGETQLRSLVESAGLVHRVDFDVQASITAESGARRPDMVLHLPGGKSMPIDAKVPYSAYMDASAIPATASGDDAQRRERLLTQHAKQVRGHVDALARKNYWTGLDASPELTIAFIPSEPILAAALEHDPTLLDYAFNKGIALASPVSLWAVFKTVAFTWQQDVLTEQAKELFDLGKELYSRIGTLSEHADKLRRSIEGTVNAYNAFAGSLEQRVLVTARRFDRLDESRILAEPQTIEQHPRRLTQPELDALEQLDTRRPEIEVDVEQGLFDLGADERRSDAG